MLKRKKQFSTKIFSFQFDWGIEFEALNKYLKQHGIHHRLSCSYTPEQNGTAEKKHRHLIETSLTLLHTTSLPMIFWDEAVCITTFLINIMPIPLLGYRSPYELLFKETPNYNF